MIPILAKAVSLLGGGSGKLVESVGGVLDNLITSKDERDAAKLEIQKEINRNLEAMQGQLIRETESYLKDVENARDANVQVQNSDKASWLAKNIAYCLDVLFVVSFITMLLVILYKQVPADNKEIFYTAFGLLGGYVSTIINFHRGTSKGSEDKGKQITKFMQEGKS